jgi:hypothetical protein
MEDASERAMRAVWRSMRDEAAPERGMVELLAAARQKAEAMRPAPTLWQRMLAVMRRPPVLALATALVLIGGAVLVGRRVMDPLRVRPAETDEQAGKSADAVRDKLGTGGSAGVTGADGAVPRSTASADRSDQRSAVPRVLGSPPVGSSAAPLEGQLEAVPRAPSPPAGHTARPEGTVLERGPAGADPAGPGGAAASAQSRSRPAVASSPGAADEATAAVPALRNEGVERALVHRGGTAGSGRSTDDDRPTGQTVEHATGPSSPAVTESAETGDRIDDPEAARTRAQSAAGGLAQLYRACEAAASRGDCATVRRLVAQIGRTDRGYRSRLAKDAAVTKCLAE